MFPPLWAPAHTFLHRALIRRLCAALHDPRPKIVVEVLSRTRADHDRGGKLYDYRRIESVQEIALVASEQRQVEIWRRRGSKWEIEDLIGDAALELETVGITIPFATIYADSGV